VERRTVTLFSVAIATAVLITLAAPAVVGAAKAQVKTGGSVTDLIVNETWPGLDPATDVQDALDEPMLNAIYGGLFEQGPNGQALPDLATGYTYSDRNLVVTISLRHGVKYQDGTPLTAQSVVANIQRDLLPANACICDATFAPMTSVTASGTYNVVLHLSEPYSPLIEAFIGSAPNYPVSLTALATKGEATFSQDPVGAGPFEVVSNVASSTLSLTKYKGYWRKGYPILDTLNFESVATDESAYSALQSNEGQIVEDLTTVPIIRQAKSEFNVTDVSGTSATGARLNTFFPPFNNINAREAIYYATNAKQILQSVESNFGSLEEAPSGPGDSFYEQLVPGYRNYNLAKASALVQQVGGLTFSIDVDGNPNVAEALQTQWDQAGMHVTVNEVNLATLISTTQNKSYDVQMGGVGGLDPSIGLSGIDNQETGSGPFTGVNDPVLNGLANRAQELTNPTARQKAYFEIYKRISDNAYEPFLFAIPKAVLAVKSLTAVNPLPGNTAPVINWEYLAYK
jgi:peptide/nickel transport system substrate-binding protein